MMTKRFIHITYLLLFALCPLVTWAGVKQVAAGNHHSLIVMTDGSLWACGYNLFGQLGDGTTTNRSTPVKVMDGVASVAAGSYHSLIVKTDGSLWACGDNEFGQLGDGTTTNRSTPVKVMDGVASVATGGHSLIVKTDGSLWACGYNKFGQLGDGTTTNRSTPVKVMDGVASVAAGSSHSLIVKTDGSLWACGYNKFGQLGDGTTTNRSTPVKVMDGVASVAVGSLRSFILKTDGSLWACGYNYYGQLGDGTTKNRVTPVKVMDGVASVAAGDNHSLIVKTDGSLWACGYNSDGQFGDGTTYRSLTPVKMMDGVASVAAGYDHSLILKTDGSLWACGYNKFGELGTGDFVNKSTPTQQLILITNYSLSGIDFRIFYDMISSIDKINGHSTLVIPDSVEYEGKNYAVTIVGDSVFESSTANNSNYHITFPSTIKTVSEHAFDTYGPSAIIWNSNTALPALAFNNTKYSEGNFLLYVNSRDIAPSNVKNVVVNGVAECITLTDGNTFCCPRNFTAKNISYTHNYKMATGIGVSSGWETIALPFTVQSIRHESKGDIVPFADYSQTAGKNPFWLYRFSDKGFVRTNTIEACTPYLIAMPNNSDYTASYCLNGKVTFSATDAKVEETAADNWHTATCDGSTFYPCFSVENASTGFYVLNVNNDFVNYTGQETPGSIFVSNSRKTMPFEGRLANTTSGSRAISIVFAEEETQGIEDMAVGRKTYHVYNIKGQRIETARGESTEETIRHLPQGIYIVNGKKIMK